MNVGDLPTPALLVDARALERNLATMAAARPGDALRPHVKAHKCTAIAAAQLRHGHRHFTCATTREMVGLAQAGIGDDLLPANETVDRGRLAGIAGWQDRVRMTVAVDSAATIDAAATAGVRDVLIDVAVGLPRCGCPPEDAGRLADGARAEGLRVRGVMGYEGHLMMVADRTEKAARVAEAVGLLRAAHADVGGEIVSAGGTGTYDLHHEATEVQAGTYALMDTDYAKLGQPFELAVSVLGTVISVSRRWAVLDVGLKALALDHGNPDVDGGAVWFCSDEHLTYAPADGQRWPVVGERVRVWPAHLDPTMAKHELLRVVEDDHVVDTWAIDLAGW